MTSLPTGLTAAYDGSGHLTGISGDISALSETTTPISLGDTLHDGNGSFSIGAVNLTIVDTTSSGNTISVASDNDYSYIDGENGGDSLMGAGTITGGAGIDYLVGSQGSDNLNGAGGNDTLIGGAGNDSLTGGAGNDWFLYNATNDGTDVIADFVSGADKLVFKQSAFTALTVCRSVVLNSSLSGTGAQFVYSGGSFTIATFTGTPALLASDFVVI